MIEAIFWDNDGVLVETEHLYFQATRETLAPLGIEVSEQTFIDISLRQGQSVLDLALDQGLSRDGMEALRLQRNGRYAELLAAESCVLEGVKETLCQLHGQIRMAVVTSSRRDHFEIIHRSSGLLQYFDFVLTREDYTHSKPHPEPYLAALARSGLAPAQCLVVEDSPRGLQAAIAAGMRCLVTPGPLTRDSDFSAASGILESIREVPSFLG